MWFSLYVIASILNLGLGILLVILLSKEPHEPKTPKKKSKQSDQALIDFIDEAVENKPGKGKK